MSENLLEWLTDDELEAKRDQILKDTAYWKKSKDGSYDMALVNKGYDKVLAEIERRKELYND